MNEPHVQPQYPERDAPVEEPTVRLVFEVDHCVNFAMQQNDVPVVKSLVIDNPLDRPLENVRVQISGEPPFCEPWEARLATVPPKSTHRFKSVDLMLSPVYLDGLTERVRGQLRVKLYEGDAVCAEAVERIHCLARNEVHVGSVRSNCMIYRIITYRASMR